MVVNRDEWARFESLYSEKIKRIRRRISSLITSLLNAGAVDIEIVVLLNRLAEKGIRVIRKRKKEAARNRTASFIWIRVLWTLSVDYNCGPDGINAFAASLSQYCTKFLMYIPASLVAFTSHSFASAYV